MINVCILQKATCLWPPCGESREREAPEGLGACAGAEGSLWLLTDPDLRRVARIRALLDFLAEWLIDRRQLGRGM
jgi:hypothetical protein